MSDELKFSFTLRDYKLCSTWLPTRVIFLKDKLEPHRLTVPRSEHLPDNSVQSSSGATPSCLSRVIFFVMLEDTVDAAQATVLQLPSVLCFPVLLCLCQCCLLCWDSVRPL